MTSSSFPVQVVQTLFQPAVGLAPVPEQKGRHWLVLLLVIAFTSVVFYQMFAGMEPAWLVEQQMAQISHEMSPAEQEQTRAYLGQSASSMPLMATVMVPIATLIFTAILAGYLMLTGRLSAGMSYGKWFALVCWSQLPALINALGLVVLLLVSDTRNVPIDAANYASLNQLVLGLVPGDKYFSWAESLNLFSLWQMWILYAGLQSAAGFSQKRAAIVASLPLIVIFGIWALLI